MKFSTPLLSVSKLKMLMLSLLAKPDIAFRYDMFLLTRTFLNLRFNRGSVIALK